MRSILCVGKSVVHTYYLGRSNDRATTLQPVESGEYNHTRGPQAPQRPQRSCYQ